MILLVSIFQCNYFQLYTLLFLVTVGFTSDQYNGSELLKFVEVMVKLSHKFDFPVTVAITPAMLSAAGKLCTDIATKI